MAYVADAEDISRIEKKIDMLKESIDQLLGRRRPVDRVTVASIAAELEVSRTFISLHPWLLPNHGAAIQKNHRSWTRREYEDWSARPIEEREHEYRQMKEEQDAKREKTVEGSVTFLVSKGKMRHSS